MHRATGCAACARLPETIPPAGTLYLAAPLEHTQEVIAELLDTAGFAPSALANNILEVAFSDDRLPDMLDRLAERLTLVEREETRVLLLRDGERPELSSFLLADRLAHLIQRSRSRWLVDVLERNALVTHFQPIVSSAAPHDLFGYEALTRGVNPDGALIPPTDLYEAAVTENLLYHLDRSARIGAIRAAQRFLLPGKGFINFTPSAIYTPEFCLRSTVAVLRQTALQPEQIVFEVVETDRVRDFTHLERILATYRDQGYSTALDDLGAGFASLSLLHTLRPQFVKIDSSLVRGVDTDRYKATIASRLLDTADALGIQSVAEGVETEAEARWLLDNGASYQQGYLFAQPATPPPPVMPITFSP